MSKKRKILARIFCKFNKRHQHRNPRSSVNSKQEIQTNKIDYCNNRSQTLQKTKDKVIKSAREIKYLTYRRIMTRIINDFSSETIEVRGQ